MEVGRKGNPARRATRLSDGLPACAVSLTVLALLIASAATIFSPARGLPSPTDNTGIATGPGHARSPSLAVDAGGALHLVRQDDASGENGVYYSRSNDGAAWAPSVRIDSPGSGAWFPRIAVEREPVSVRGRLYVAYEASATTDANISFTSSDGGLWSAPGRLDMGPPNTQAVSPAIAASGGGVYVAWSDNRAAALYQVFVRASVNGGASWGPERQLSFAGALNNQVRVDAKGSTVAVVWRQWLASGGTQILSARSDDAGSTWRQSTVVEDLSASGNLVDPDVVLDELAAEHVAWSHQGPTGEMHIEYAWSGDGVSWSSPVTVDDMTGLATARNPSIAEVAGTLWITWGDRRNGDYDVFASWSTDGIRWGDGVRNDGDLRVDDTDRNAVATDDATDQVNPVVRTGGFGVYATWEDYRSGSSWDVYYAPVDASPLVITEMQDEPASQARVEIYNYARTPFSMAGVSLVVGSQTVDLSSLGFVSARGYVVIGAPSSSDLQVNVDLGMDGALVQVVRGSDVLASAGSGTYGVAPDPLPYESTSRYAGTLDYATSWTRTTPASFAVRNVATPPNLAPPLVLNQILFNPSTPTTRFVQLVLRGNVPLDLTGYRLVGDATFTFTGGVLDATSRYASVFEARDGAWFAPLGAQQDNVYLYDAAGRLLDMVGWSSRHTAGMSMTRAVEGEGGHLGYDDGSSALNGWAFDVVPNAAAIDLQSDATVLADVGTSVQFGLVARNLQSSAEFINIEGTATTAWPFMFMWPNGTALSDSAGDPDSIPDLGLVPGGVSVNFACMVSVPLEGTIGDRDVVTATASAASIAVARASVNLTINLYPHFDVTRTVSPPTVYMEGTGPPYNEVGQITVTVRGAGLPIVSQLPQDVVFQIDESGSMSNPPLNSDPGNLRIDAVENYIDAMHIDDRGVLIGFRSTAWVVNDRPLTYTDPGGQALLKGDAETLRCPCFGGTNIDSALQAGNNVLITQGNTSRARVEILLTDGRCEPGCTNTANLVNQAVSNGLVIYTIGLGGGVDANFLRNIAIPTGGQYYFARTAQDLAAIYTEIGMRINRTAGVALPNLAPMIEDDVAQSLTVIPGTFVDPATGAPRDPSLNQQTGDRTILQWAVARILINETWSVRYNVTSIRFGPQDVALHPDSRVAYLRWDGSTVFQTIPQGNLTVLVAPSPPFITATAPADGTMDVTVAQPIQAVFSEDMNGASVQWIIAPAVALTPAWLSQQILTFAHPDFAECTWYTVQITAGRDSQGESLVPGPAPNPWSFRTTCPVNYTITRSPLLGIVQVDGFDYPAPATFHWRAGDVHRIFVVDFDPQGFSRWAFLSWDDGGARDHTVTVGAADRTITAAFALQHSAALTLVGLVPARPARVASSLFGSPASTASASSWGSWVDDGSPLTVDAILLVGADERYVTRDPAAWTVTAPMDETVHYFHQFTATLHLVGIDGYVVPVGATAFGADAGGAAGATWSTWVDARTDVSLDSALAIGTRERYRTLDSVRWMVNAPLDETVSYFHQFQPHVVLLGLDGEHTVKATWRIDGHDAGADRLTGGLEEWADAGAALVFDSQSSGKPTLYAQDPASFVVDRAFDATIRYSISAPPNWKPLLSLVYSILLAVAGMAFSRRALDRFVPPPPGGDVRARRFAWRGLPLGRKLNELSIAEVEEKVHRDRRFTRLLLILPFAGIEGAIGLLSLFTGVFRLPEAGSWAPVGFWVNTGLVVAGVLTGWAVQRKGYRMTNEALLKLAEARAKAAERAAANGAPPPPPDEAQ